MDNAHCIIVNIIQFFYVSADEIWQVFFVLVEDVQNLSVNFYHNTYKNTSLKELNNVS